LLLLGCIGCVVHGPENRLVERRGGGTPGMEMRLVGEGLVVIDALLLRQAKLVLLLLPLEAGFEPARRLHIGRREEFRPRAQAIVNTALAVSNGQHHAFRLLAIIIKLLWRIAIMFVSIALASAWRC